MEETLKQEIVALIKENTFQDSISIGNSKTGEVKVYVDFNRKEDAETKLNKAIALLKAHRAEILG